MEDEAEGECEQRSRVGNCVISEVPGVPNDESGWVFLEFERVESATEAVVDLNGRYFGRWAVKVCF